jgi:hypothetical protein
VNPL